MISQVTADNLAMLWLFAGGLVAMHVVKPVTSVGLLMVLIAWPLALIGAGIVALAREWRRRKDFPRSTIVRYRGSNYLYGCEREASDHDSHHNGAP